MVLPIRLEGDDTSQSRRTLTGKPPDRVDMDQAISSEAYHNKS
jgi:hypothetical protein